MADGLVQTVALLSFCILRKIVQLPCFLKVSLVDLDMTDITFLASRMLNDEEEPVPVGQRSFCKDL